MPPFTSGSARATSTRQRNHNDAAASVSSPRVRRRHIVYHITSDSDDDDDDDDDDDGINTGGFVMPSNSLMVVGSGGRSLPSASVASTTGGRGDSSPRRRQTRGLPGLAPGRTRPGLPPWATPPRPPHVQPRGLSAHTAFQGSPICFSPAKGSVIDSSSCYVDSARRRRAAHKVLVLLAAYQVVLWIAIFGSNVLQINAERGCEACIYLAHVAREVGEHPFVLLLGMVYGQFI
ncbi:hypothetical protein ColTof4_01427 [Colletotrichum tofieldiae]|nr:hypothetical protein ColTof3_08684 [Colletotrichum tofieldiae]GKT69004.1 hypothetical protein ColTof4_01427 [Colletotrichum tofieldiae]